MFLISSSFNFSHFYHYEINFFISGNMLSFEIYLDIKMPSPTWFWLVWYVFTFNACFLGLAYCIRFAFLANLTIFTFYLRLFRPFMVPHLGIPPICVLLPLIFPACFKTRICFNFIPPLLYKLNICLHFSGGFIIYSLEGWRCPQSIDILILEQPVTRNT